MEQWSNEGCGVFVFLKNLTQGEKQEQQTGSHGCLRTCHPSQTPIRNHTLMSHGPPAPPAHVWGEHTAQRNKQPFSSLPQYHTHKKNPALPFVAGTPGSLTQAGATCFQTELRKIQMGTTANERNSSIRTSFREKGREKVGLRLCTAVIYSSKKHMNELPS